MNPRHPHIVITFLDGVSVDRCLEGIGWRMNDYTTSLVVGTVGLPRTHYPLANIRHFDLDEHLTSCREGESTEVHVPTAEELTAALEQNKSAVAAAIKAARELGMRPSEAAGHTVEFLVSLEQEVEELTSLPATHKICPDGQGATHHLIPRRKDGGIVQACIYCKKTQKELENA